MDKIQGVLPLTKCEIPMPKVNPPRKITSEERAKASKIAYDKAVKIIKRDRKKADKYGGLAGINEMGFYAYTGER